MTPLAKEEMMLWPRIGPLQGGELGVGIDF